MDKQTDPTVFHSSIALLQERFRQLERAKEMRQEKELFRMLSESKQINAAMPHVPSRSFFHSELMLQPELPLQSTLYSEANMHMQNKHTQVQANQTPILENLWSRDTVMHKTNFDDSDVDTSLHL
ncbi:hypothetical protein SLE2022_398620 [Rubroshorea leprosula]